MKCTCLGGGHTLRKGRQRLLPPLAVVGEACLAVVVQAVAVGAVTVEVARWLDDAALVARLLQTCLHVSTSFVCHVNKGSQCERDQHGALERAEGKGSRQRVQSEKTWTCVATGTFSVTVGASMRCFFLRRSVHWMASHFCRYKWLLLNLASLVLGCRMWGSIVGCEAALELQSVSLVQVVLYRKCIDSAKLRRAAPCTDRHSRQYWPCCGRTRCTTSPPVCIDRCLSKAEGRPGILAVQHACKRTVSHWMAASKKNTRQSARAACAPQEDCSRGIFGTACCPQAPAAGAPPAPPPAGLRAAGAALPPRRMQSTRH